VYTAYPFSPMKDESYYNSYRFFGRVETFQVSKRLTTRLISAFQVAEAMIETCVSFIRTITPVLPVILHQKGGSPVNTVAGLKFVERIVFRRLGDLLRNITLLPQTSKLLSIRMEQKVPASKPSSGRFITSQGGRVLAWNRLQWNKLN